MNTISWIVSLPLLLLSLWAIAGNLWIMVGGLFKKQKKFQSFVPLLGGITGTIGIAMLPIEGMRPFWWLPLIADVGCVPLFIAVAADQIKKRFSPTSRK
jgi:hypothetical protein